MTTVVSSASKTVSGNPDNATGPVVSSVNASGHLVARPPHSHWSERYRREPFYRGGKVVVLDSAKKANTHPRLCTLHPHASGWGAVLVNSEGLGSIERVFGEEDEEATTFAIRRRATTASATNSEESIIAATATRRGLIRLFDGEKEIRSFSSLHSGPISDMDIDATGECLATGSADTTIRVWSISGGFATHNFKGHRAIISVVRFHPDADRFVLASADVSGAVCLWDLTSKDACAWLRSHMSVVPSLCYLGRKALVTVGRDRVLSVWSVPAKIEASGSKRNLLQKTVPALESLEGVVALPHLDATRQGEKLHFATVGSAGLVKLWSFDVKSNECHLIQQSQTPRGPLSHVHLCAVPRGKDASVPALVVVSEVECLLEFLDCSGLEADKRVRTSLVGFDDEITDACLIPKTNQIVCASNSEAVRVFGIPELSRSETGVTLLRGHTGPVLCAAASPVHDFFVTGSKDQTVRVWGSTSLKTIGVGQGHTEPVVASFVSATSRLFATSGGDDMSVRVWSAPEEEDEEIELTTLAQVVAHSKPVTDVALSPHDAYVGTASMDKTCKIWKLEAAASSKRVKHSGSSKSGPTMSLTLAVELKGHKRAVHSIRFSPTDRVVCTASADATLRVWSITNGECVRTLEGHASPCTKSWFFPGGTVVASASSEGAIKTWDLKSSLSLHTVDHGARVWGLVFVPDAAGAQDALVSVGESGTLCVWRDTTAEQAEAEFRARKAAASDKEALDRAIRTKEYEKAASLALRLDRPHQLRTILERAFQGAASDNLKAFVAKLAHEEADTQIRSLLKSIISWNTSARTCALAQRCIAALVSPSESEALRLKVGKRAVDEFVNACRPYTERHARRLDRLIQSSYLIDHALFSCDDERASMLLMDNLLN